MIGSLNKSELTIFDQAVDTRDLLPVAMTEVDESIQGVEKSI
jgi:hypothetical protein